MDSNLLKQLAAMAREASQLILEIYRESFVVEYKSPGDPVTAADRRANELLCTRLSQAFPSVPIVAEESAPESYRSFSTADEAFFVDPLDGTREFVARNGEFAVMVGLARGGRAAAGVVVAPVNAKLWAGEVEGDAWSQTGDGATEPLAVNVPRTLSEATLLASRSHRSADGDRALRLLGVGKVQALGSAGLKGCWVAEGKADIYLSPGMAGMRWDACAIDAVVHAAGGRLTDSRGAPISYQDPHLENRDGLLAAAPAVHSELVERLELLRRQHGH